MNGKKITKINNYHLKGTRPNNNQCTKLKYIYKSKIESNVGLAIKIGLILQKRLISATFPGPQKIRV